MELVQLLLILNNLYIIYIMIIFIIYIYFILIFIKYKEKLFLFNKLKIYKQLLKKYYYFILKILIKKFYIK